MRWSEERLNEHLKKQGARPVKVTRKRSAAQTMTEHQQLVNSIAALAATMAGVITVKADASRVRDFVGNFRPQGATEKGTPDLLFLFSPVGLVRWMDAKTGEGTLSKDQKGWAAKAAECGITGCECRSLAHAEKQLKQWKAEAESIAQACTIQTRQILQATGVLMFKVKQGLPAAYLGWIRREVETLERAMRGNPDAGAVVQSETDYALLQAAKAFGANPTIDNGSRIVNLCQHFEEAN